MSLFTSNPITELEPQTKAKIRSTQILTSLPHLISELVQNSLDAGASHVEVGLDPIEWECWVRDDGQGMSAEGLGMLGKGHDQGRYNTSKTYDNTHVGSNTFGFRGEALASAMELSCLEISSRTVRSRESRSVIIKGGEQLYLGPSVRWRRERPGTTVVARDIFYNVTTERRELKSCFNHTENAPSQVPVRRKSHPNSARTLELAKKELETLALVFPHVSFSMDHTHAGQKTRILTIPRTASSLATFRVLYGRALIEHAEEINLRSEDLGLEGFISLGGSQSRGFQNFYVNKHPMAFGDIQRAVEKCFASSAFSRFASDEQTGPYNPSHARRSPKKTERKPIYVLNLSISPSQVDNFVEPAKSMVHFQASDTNRVLAFVLEVVNRFLERNNILSMQSRPGETNLGSPRKRIRREDAQSSPSYTQGDHFTGSMPNVQGQALPPHELPETTSLHSAHIGPDTDEPLATFDDSGYFEWTDPSSGESFLVDSNTGNSFPRNRLPDHIRKDVSTSVDDIGKNMETLCFDRRSLRPSNLGSESRAEKPQKIPEWLVKAMQQNPTFHPTEQDVFSTGTIDPGVQRPRPHAHTFKSWGNRYASNLSQSSKLTSDTFSASDLKSARVVAQVDTKFIACLLQPPDRILALVDQHAADERVRVERYLKRLCSGFLRGEVEVLKMDKPKRVLLTRRETEILQGQGALDSLERWGLWLELNVPTSQQGPSTREFEFAQVDVTGVPDVISSKLATERELSAFTRSMVATVETNESTPWPIVSSDSQGERDWVKALRYCPAPLLELVNSKACRGAIMFNDPLDLGQCEHLIQQLSETVFPFQCAHGRPSIAPLTKVAGVKPRPVVVDWEAFDQDDG